MGWGGLEDWFYRMELYVKDCPSYNRTLWNAIMVVCSWLPYNTYVFLFINSFYDRTIFHAVACWAFLINTAILWLFQAVVPEVNNCNAPCRSLVGCRPCEESAIASCVVFFYIFSYLHVYKTHPHKVYRRIAWLVAYYVLSNYSLYSLQTYNSVEIIVGDCIGALSAVIAVIVFRYLHSHRTEVKLKFLFDFLYIDLNA